MHLTENEKRVLKATDGRPIRVIADELGMTERNVKFHSDSIRTKFGVKQRWELIELRQRYLDAGGVL